MARDAELAAQVEELVLHGGQEVADVRGDAGHGEDHADRAVAFVHAAVGLDARVVLGDAAAVAESGRAVVAGARVDLGQAVAHVLPQRNS